jgi:hypothetical protein
MFVSTFKGGYTLSAKLLMLVGVVLMAVSGQGNLHAQEDLSAIALRLISERIGVPASAFELTSSTTMEFPLTGKSVIAFNFFTRSYHSRFHTVMLDMSGNEFDRATLFADEAAAYDAKYGRLEPQLAEFLATAPPDTPINVGIWLKKPEYNEIAALSDDASEEQAEAYLMQFREQKISIAASVNTPIIERLNAMGHDARAMLSYPIVDALLPPATIREIEQWAEVDRIYLSTKAEPAMEWARPTIRADVVQSRGYNGSGVKVAQVDIPGRIATSNPYLANVVQDTTYLCASPAEHSTAVAGIIRANKSGDTKLRGIAPNASLWTGGSCEGQTSELRIQSDKAITWGAKALNLSWGSDTNLVLDYTAEFYDRMVLEDDVTVVAAAGNRGNLGCSQGEDGEVISPGLGYNVITVGAFYDNNTSTWSDDTMWRCSSWKNPISKAGERQKPEVAAPGEGIISTSVASPWNNYTSNGTSLATAMVTGAVAQMMHRSSALKTNPEQVKAILMASAVHNIEGSSRFSDYDGAGGISVDRADDIIRGVGGKTGNYTYSCGTSVTAFQLTTLPLTAGKRTRVVISWSTDPSDQSNVKYVDGASIDFDMTVDDPPGLSGPFAENRSNTFEIIEFTPDVSGNWKLMLDPRYCKPGTSTKVGWAWLQV